MIAIHNLNYSIRKKKILSHVNFEINEGEFWLILGPNGAGKSTLLKIICGLIHDYEGSVRIHEKESRDFSPRDMARIISYQPQFDEFSLPLKVNEILLAGRYPYKSFFKDYSESDYQCYNDVIRRLNLEAFLDRDINTLSGGERKKVMLASAFIQDVSIIIFDEPFTFLDPGAISNLKKMMIETHRLGKTVIVVSHDLPVLFPIVGKILALKNGSVIYSGDRVFDKTMLKSTYDTTFEKYDYQGKELLFLEEES